MRRGQCLCGAVRFEARSLPDTIGICHCAQCQRWTGSALVEVSVPETDVTWDGPVKVYRSSHWAERAFCEICGTGLYFRVTQEGDFSGNYDIPLGLFDDRSGFDVGYEIFVDQKPDAYAFEDKGQARLTRAECVAKFPTLAEEAP